jgi:hypothetical protein
MGKTVHNVRQTLQKKLNNYNTLHLLFGLITIYDWLIKPEEVLNACADLEKEIKEQNKPKQK